MIQRYSRPPSACDFCYVQCCYRTKRIQVSLSVSECKVTPTLTSVLLEGSRRGQQRRRRVVVHISADANASTLPAAPSVAGRTRPVSDRTPLNNKGEKEPESPYGFYGNVSAEVLKGTTSRPKNLVVDFGSVSWVVDILVTICSPHVSIVKPTKTCSRPLDGSTSKL